MAAFLYFFAGNPKIYFDNYKYRRYFLNTLSETKLRDLYLLTRRRASRPFHMGAVSQSLGQCNSH